MKYLKTFENLDDLKYFLDKHNAYVYHMYQTSYHPEELANNYFIPKEIIDDFSIVYYFYEKDFYWKKGDKVDNNRIKREMKKYIISTILNKIENEPELYLTIKKFLDKRKKFNDTGSFDYITNRTIKYFYFILHDVIRRVPDWLIDSINFNL